jgi:hypothetical protein
MSDKAKQLEYSWRNELKRNGWDISKTDSIQFNSGSETTRHIVCKSLVGRYLKHECNLRIDSEVTHPERGEIDIVAYGEESPPFAVEVETNVTDDVTSDKLERYYEGTPLREVYILELLDMPTDWNEAYQWVAEELGLHD